jgi:hypothetical protein
MLLCMYHVMLSTMLNVSYVLLLDCCCCCRCTVRSDAEIDMLVNEADSNKDGVIDLQVS